MVEELHMKEKSDFMSKSIASIRFNDFSYHLKSNRKALDMIVMKSQ